MDPLRIALLTNLEEEFTSASTSNESVFTYELASALLQSAKNTGGISIDVIARKSVAGDLPVISIDPSELGEISVDPLNRFAYQDAIYSLLLLKGMLNEYALVHCLAPVVTPILLLAANGIPIVQTITVDSSHPCVDLLPKLAGSRLRQVSIGAYDLHKNIAAIPPSVDLSRFHPVTKPDDNFIFWPGKKDEKVLMEIKPIATSLGLPLYTFEDGNPEDMVKHARLTLYFPNGSLPCEPIWLIRALACGTPIASWSTPVFKQLFCRTELGIFANKNDITSLKEGIKNILPRDEGTTIRREYALGMFGQRSQAARYRDLYKSFFSELKT